VVPAQASQAPPSRSTSPTTTETSGVGEEPGHRVPMRPGTSRLIGTSECRCSERRNPVIAGPGVPRPFDPVFRMSSWPLLHPNARTTTHESTAHTIPE
jgi:hypothetical protein